MSAELIVTVLTGVSVILGLAGANARTSAKLGRQIESVRQDMQTGDESLRQEIQSLRQDTQTGDESLRQEIQSLRQDMQTGDENLRTEIRGLRQDVRNLDNRVDSTNARIDRLSDVLASARLTDLQAS